MGSMSSPTSPINSISPASSLQPTWQGYIADTWDALILFEAAISGHLNRVVRRPHDRERNTLIRSGSVFIYEESASGIKRWTDGVAWSPSRILNNFLIYRELEKPFPPGEKKRATKKQNKSPQGAADPFRRPSSGDDMKLVGAPIVSQAISPSQSATCSTPSAKPDSYYADREAERSLVGSLTDSYAFKEGGLVKKTMSVVVDSVHYHLVSYYNPEDVKANMLSKPRDTDLRFVKVRSDLIQQQNFRAPIDDEEELPSSFHAQEHTSNQFTVASPTQPTYMPSHGYVQHGMATNNQYYNNQAPITYQMPQQQHRYQMPQQDFAEQARLAPMQHSQQLAQAQFYQNMTDNSSQMHAKPQYNEYSQYQERRTFNPTQQNYGNPSGWNHQ